MEHFLTQAGLAAVFLFGFLEACCVPIPSEITFGFAGVLAGQGRLNIVAVIIVGTVAELLGSLVSYGIGRVGGRPLVHRFGRYLLVTQADIDRAERFFAGRGAWAVPLGRALPIVRTFVSIVAGFIEMPVALFGLLSLIGTAVWVTAISLIGYGLGSAWHSVAHGLSLAGYVIVALAVVAVAVFIVHRVREVRAETAAARGAKGGHAAGGGAMGRAEGGTREPGSLAPGSRAAGGLEPGSLAPGSRAAEGLQPGGLEPESGAPGHPRHRRENLTGEREP